MNKNITFILLASLFLFSCKDEQGDKVYSNNRQLVKIDKNQIAIHDLIPVSGDTLIAAMWSGGILKTIDGGVNWVEIETPLLKQLSVDSSNRIWGIDSWVGIHEESYSRIFYSDNLGETWERFECDLNEFFPLKFNQEFNSTVQIVTWDGLIMEYKGGLPNNVDNWENVMKLKDGEIEFKAKNPKVNGDYRILTNGLLQKKSKEENWDEVITISNISIPFDILEDSNNVYIAAGGYGGYKALFVEILNDSIQIERDMNSVQSLGVRKDNKGRIWTFGDGGIFQIDGNNLKKMK